MTVRGIWTSALEGGNRVGKFSNVLGRGALLLSSSGAAGSICVPARAGRTRHGSAGARHRRDGRRGGRGSARRRHPRPGSALGTTTTKGARVSGLSFSWAMTMLLYDPRRRCIKHTRCASGGRGSGHPHDRRNPSRGERLCKNRRERREVAFRRSAGPFRRERNGAQAPKGRVPRMGRATGVYVEIHEDSEHRRNARSRVQ